MCVHAAPIGGEMARYRLISGSRGRAFVSIEDKVCAIAEIFLKHRPRGDVLRPIYEKAGRPLPDNTSVVIHNWKRSIQDKLDRNDQYTIDLCKRYNIVEEVGEEEAGVGETPRPPRKKTQRRRSPVDRN